MIQPLASSLKSSMYLALPREVKDIGPHTSPQTLPPIRSALGDVDSSNGDLCILPPAQSSQTQKSCGPVPKFKPSTILIELTLIGHTCCRARISEPVKNTSDGKALGGSKTFVYLIFLILILFLPDFCIRGSIRSKFLFNKVYQNHALCRRVVGDRCAPNRQLLQRSYFDQIVHHLY
ncbi:hypothetical protein OUZ56_029647 [Daphnia magna]|uniref:Uncharacterized protein n=1 Tax=Daphnia magna TaxID=35525 RepID=A0ABR0B7F2_9CRUS|nr:hypothetical protein OUZ56_029647 [Daphnia magna]